MNSFSYSVPRESKPAVLYSRFARRANICISLVVYTFRPCCIGCIISVVILPRCWLNTAMLPSHPLPRCSKRPVTLLSIQALSGFAIHHLAGYHVGLLQGGLINFSSFVPNPIATSSCESETNTILTFQTGKVVGLRLNCTDCGFSRQCIEDAMYASNTIKQAVNGGWIEVQWSTAAIHDDNGGEKKCRGRRSGRSPQEIVCKYLGENPQTQRDKVIRNGWKTKLWERSFDPKMDRSHYSMTLSLVPFTTACHGKLVE
jgi:hypothetical protein